MTAYRAATAEQAAFLAELIAHGHLVETDVAGIYGQGRDFDRVRNGFSEALWRLSAPDGPEAMRFPSTGRRPRPSSRRPSPPAMRTGAGSSR